MKSALVLWAVLAGVASAQQVPPEVQRIADNYKRDSTVDYGFLEAQELLKLARIPTLVD
jgi:hypothetical protein